ncbi:MAG TPA: hypothetical protein VMF53_08565 [Alphaproteobacteria bacterium]|nr:hypothetical protein [Alphaproteobacteria bacterium]
MSTLAAKAFGVMLLAALLALAPGRAAWAQAQPYQVGDRVAAPFGAQFLDSVIVRIDAGSPFPYRVHPLGYVNTMDTSFNAQMLHAPGSVKTAPVGGIANDPYLLAVQGKQPFHPTKVFTGAYQCWTLSGVRLEPALMLNFSILDGGRYRDHGGVAGAYAFDAASQTLVFQGGALDGRRAKYEQASDPPTASQPPAITLEASGDRCDRPIR